MYLTGINSLLFTYHIIDKLNFFCVWPAEPYEVLNVAPGKNLWRPLV